MTLRGYGRLIAAALLLAVCLPLWAIARLTGGEQRWNSRFLRMAGWLLGLRTRTDGWRAEGGVLIVANHVSWLDILALGGAMPCRFVAKAEIGRWPVIGRLARIGRTVFVARDRRSGARAQADAVTEALGDSLPLVLFAEGGTGDGRTLGAFRPALFISAIEAGAAVQPVAIDYGPDRARLAWPSGQSFGPEAKRLLNRRGTVPVTLRFLPPLDSRTLDRKALAALSHAAVRDALS
ncbi:lysophospholipid acyltransferase family protein [Sphingomonas bacterium]|uniref:lysophospholipid acyltransferase family protein n=1 Tax=Sphingomonas bacterium TaxID=1895847 RepID=UPI00157539C2|nr:lysophospholipid acyltransferase family protein [Sphingomonas bacterium]